MAEEQEAARRVAERQAQEDAEAAKWVGQISTEKEGTQASMAEEEEVQPATLDPTYCQPVRSFLGPAPNSKAAKLEETAVRFSNS